MFYKIWQFIKNPVGYFQDRNRVKRRLEELRKRDPFIYK
jgi:hypothetical protein